MKDSFSYFDNQKRTVLIADSEKTDSELLSNALKSDYNLIFAETESEVLDIITKNSKMISLILLDVATPDTNGFKILKRIKSADESKNIPVIALTSDVFSEIQSLK